MKENLWDFISVLLFLALMTLIGAVSNRDPNASSALAALVGFGLGLFLVLSAIVGTWIERRRGQPFVQYG